MQIFYGYMRVSTIEQNNERQKQELIRWGVLEKHIFSDELSGKDFNRPEYQKVKRKIKKGDVLVVKSIDRLGRNYADIQEEWRYLIKEKGADIVILDMPILDTRTNKDLIGTLISDIVLQLLSYVAQAERDFLRQRQAEGIAIAKAQGKHLGRRPNPLPEGFEKVYAQMQAGELTCREAANRLCVSYNALRGIVYRHRKAQKKNTE